LFAPHDYVCKELFHGSTLKQDLVSLKFVRPDVAIWKCSRQSAEFKSRERRPRIRLLQVMVKDGGGWRISAYHNTDVKPGQLDPG
jgi:hypothetical protein